ncbi:trehalose operon repressor [Lactococcus fujiensis]|uniref:Trehalose operon repressor n=1 Tax=Lactococcus fujiensis JCM 16395 TaxID=1291764 RepID=A0A2A5RP14_9LACT|nr:trehalose operon repressor [Lactococcus fujiensis]PCS01048.1 trehalose operon transcriptional repressor [Lactococcus fujiensis JCM 16395]
MKKYEIVLQDLEKKILNQTYIENTLLPSENELASIYEVSRATIRQALKILEDSGLIQRRHGFGSTVIAQRKILFPMTGLISYKELQQSLHFESQTDVLVFERLIVTDQLAAITNFPIGVECFHILRRRLVDGKYSILDRDFFRFDIARNLTKAQAADSIYEYLENELGLDIAYAQKEIVLDFVNEDDQKLLDLNPTDHHVVSVRSHVYLSDNTPFQYTESRHQVDKFRFTEFARRQKH